MIRRLMLWLFPPTYEEPLAAWEIRAIDEHDTENAALVEQQYDDEVTLTARAYWEREGAYGGIIE